MSKLYAGAHVVKAFNHLPAEQLGANGRQAVFLSSNDTNASAMVAKLANGLGFAPIELGRLNEGGVPLHFVNLKAGGTIFQNLVKSN